MKPAQKEIFAVDPDRVEPVAIADPSINGKIACRSPVIVAASTRSMKRLPI